jgi:CubicO group peptidase (beta-lactamase class C family)
VPASHVSAREAILLEERLAQTVPERMSREGVSGLVIVLLRNGTRVWMGAFGMADPQAGRAMTPDALFRVESISKPVTAWGAMRLAETGRLDLDASLTECLADWQPPGGLPPITPRELLSHSTGIGLGDYAARYAPGAPRPGLTEHLAEDFSIIGAPGNRFAYPDTGFNLLELVIEACTGEDFGTLMAREVLAPLGMDGASFDWTGANMPVGHDLRGRPVLPYVYPGRASGGLHATASDIARFALAGMSRSEQDVLSAGAVAEMHRPVVEVGGLFGFAADGYGLVHFTEKLSDGRKAVWHGGQGHGWMSHLHIVPDSGDGIVILSNSQRAWPLVAVILWDWSESLGVAPVGMSRVLWAETGARSAIVLAVFAAAFALWIALRGRPRLRALRLTVGGMAAALILWPLWAATKAPGSAPGQHRPSLLLIELTSRTTLPKTRSRCRRM